MADDVAAKLKQIEAQLAVIETGYASILRTYYNLFYNSEPMDIELQIYAEDGSVQTITVPNRAKDRTGTITGIDDPEGNVIASYGAFYINTTAHTLWYKTTMDGSKGWQKVYSDANGEELLGGDYTYSGTGEYITNLNISNVTQGLLTVRYGGTGLQRLQKGRILVGNGDDPITYAEEGVDYMAPDDFASMVCFVPTINKPNGFLVCDGAAYKVATYTRLYEKIGSTFCTADDRNDPDFGYINADGEWVWTKFRVPNLDGLFIRCWCGSTNTYDTEEGRELGSIQKSAIPNIKANWAQEITGAEDSFQGSVYIVLDDNGNYKKVDGRTSAPAGSYDYEIGFDASKSSDLYIDDMDEVRVTNIALMPVIKY